MLIYPRIQIQGTYTHVHVYACTHVSKLEKEIKFRSKLIFKLDPIFDTDVGFGAPPCMPSEGLLPIGHVTSLKLDPTILLKLYDFYLIISY